MTNPEPPRWGYVYVMLRADGVRKVGCSSNTRKRRVALNAQTGVKHTIEKSWKLPFPQARIAERLIHLELKPRKFNDGGSIELYALAYREIEKAVVTGLRLAKQVCVGGTQRDLSATEIIEIAAMRDPLEPRRAAMGHMAWMNAVRQVDVPKNPKTWRSWSTRVLVEMYQSGRNMDWIDLDTYKPHFRNGLSPIEVVQQESENAHIEA